jgi:hypothetical protein
LGELCSEEPSVDTSQASKRQLQLMPEAAEETALAEGNGGAAKHAADRDAAHEKGRATAQSCEVGGDGTHVVIPDTDTGEGSREAGANDED